MSKKKHLFSADDEVILTLKETILKLDLSSIELESYCVELDHFSETLTAKGTASAENSRVSFQLKVVKESPDKGDLPF